jgi:maltooligosyltrehalose trehalohydrolase
VPDPLEPSTFQSAVLDWDSLQGQTATKRLALVQRLLAIRRQQIIPRLVGAAFGKAHAAENGLLTASWRLGDGATLQLLANLSNDEITRAGSEPTGTRIWGDSTGERLPPWAVRFHLGAK